jgi:F0F1-type ATP synthase membrane subunit b/b'
VKAQFKIYTNFIFSILNSQLNYNCVFISFFLTKIKQRSINMFPSVSVNPNGAHYSPSPLQEQVQQMREQIGQVHLQVGQQIHGQIQQGWERIWQMPGEVLAVPEQAGALVGEQLAQQLEPMLERAVQPMQQGMQEIWRQSPTAARELVGELAERVVQTIDDEHVQQACQQMENITSSSTDQEKRELTQMIGGMVRDMQQGLQGMRPELQQNMAQWIWEILGFAIDGLELD